MGWVVPGKIIKEGNTHQKSSSGVNYICIRSEWILDNIGWIVPGKLIKEGNKNYYKKVRWLDLGKIIKEGNKNPLYCLLYPSEPPVLSVIPIRIPCIVCYTHQNPRYCLLYPSESPGMFFTEGFTSTHADYEFKYNVYYFLCVLKV